MATGLIVGRQTEHERAFKVAGSFSSAFEELTQSLAAAWMEFIDYRPRSITAYGIISAVLNKAWDFLEIAYEL